MLVPPLPSTLGCFGEGNLPCHEGASGMLRRGTLGKELSHVRGHLRSGSSARWGLAAGSFLDQHVSLDGNITKDSELGTLHQTTPQRVNAGVLSC